jgi:hypothetical protein
MASEPQTAPPSEGPAAPNSVEMPRPTVAPFVLAVGLTLLAAGIALGLTFSAAGVVVILAALGMWVGQLLPGRGHVHEPLVEPARRPHLGPGAPGRVEQLRPGVPGYRFRLPEAVHPVSAGIKGGLFGGLVMPIPAVLWGLFSGYGPWYPVNLLGGMALPMPPNLDHHQLDLYLQDFHGSLFFIAVVIHIMLSVVIGLIYGVLLPTLAPIPRPIAWGGLLMPIVWTAASYLAMCVVNPNLPGMVSWPWFVVSQLVYGITMPAVVLAAKRWHPVLAGVAGGLIGGGAMAVPALLWASVSGRGLWYPVNLLAGMILRDPAILDPSALGTFHAEWFVPAAALHVVLSSGFGVLFALLIPKLPPIPGPIAWGGLVLPLVWTAISYGLMGVVNPVLQEHVDWFWFIVSQFVFGVAAALVVLRSGVVHVPPAGRGPDRVDTFVTGEGGTGS